MRPKTKKTTRAKMADDKKTKRNRPHIARTRLSDEELEAFQARAARAEISLSALIRYAVLNQKPPRASRQPSASRIELARINATLGDVAEALRETHITGASPLEIEAMHRDLADMRVALFQALGRGP